MGCDDFLRVASGVGPALFDGQVMIGAGHDLSATAAQIAGTHDVTLAAGNNLSLTNGVDTHSESHDKTVSKSGLMGDGIGVMIGASKQSQSYDHTQTSAVGSLVGSTDGKVTLSAGNDLHITGSDVISQTGTAIVGNTVTIDAAVGTTDATQTFKQQSAGIHLGVAGGAASVAQAVYGAQQSASHSDDSRVKALYAAQAAQALYSKGAGNAMGLGDKTGTQAVGQAAGGSTQGMSLRIGIGASSASSTTKTHDDTAYGSHISSAGDITIAATGGDLNVIGSQISGDNVALAAANNLNLLSQAEQHTDTNHSKNGSGEVGFSVGSQTGFYVTASMGKGEAHGNGTTHLDSSVSASNTLSLISGNDTTIQGAQASGNTVLASIGGNLNLASEQDTDDYAAKQWQVGGTFVYGSGGGFNLSAGKTDSHYASVTQTSGISAGTGGYQIAVGGNTDLKGAVIASTADPSRNLLNTGSLSYSDIVNQASYSAASVSLGSGVKGLMPGLSVPQGKDSHSTTQAAVSAGSIVVRDHPGQDLSGLSRDASLANSHALTNRFDPTKLADQQLAGQLAGQVLMTGVGDLEQSHQWATGSNQATALHTAAGALAAGLGGGNALGGALGAGAGEAATPWLEGQFSNTGTTLAAGVLGAVVGGGAGASTALAGDVYNRQLHREEAVVLEQIKKGRSPEEQQRLTDAACALTQCASGVPDGDPAKPALVASQERGQTYTDEQSSLLATGMFGYSGWNSVADWSSRNQVGTRSAGALQWLGGNLQMVGAVAAASTCETGIGCVAATYLYTTGADNAIAGSQTTLSGMATPTLGGQTLQALGMSPWAAELVYGATQLGAGVLDSAAGSGSLAAPTRAGGVPNAGAVNPVVNAADQEVVLFSNKFPKDPIGDPKFVPNDRLSGVSGNFNYVVTEDGSLIVGRSGHTSLAGGADVQAAGEVQLYNGNIKWIDNSSGHYQPFGPTLQPTAENAFNSIGLDAAGKFKYRTW